MPTIKAHLRKKEDQSYRILIKEGLLKRLPSILKKARWGSKYAIITDTTIGRLFGSGLVESLRKKRIEAHLFTFPAGDKHKNISSVEKIMEEMVGKNITRKDAVIALGGGVVGDLGGFVASIYMRGIPYVHVPTTLIAMADSSIGGKTGVNLEAGKNLAGRIYQPKAVYMDPKLIQKLPENELLSGMGEVVKYGIILSPSLFKMLEEDPQRVLKRSPEFLNKIIIQACRIKVSVIEKDEQEQGFRRILNYGHTIGHALEKMSNYSVTHGESITMGMKLINIMSTKRRLLKKKDRERINNLIDNIGILKNTDTSILQKKNGAKIWKIMQSDKKMMKGHLLFIVATGIGKTTTYDRFTQKDLEKALALYD